MLPKLDFASGRIDPSDHTAQRHVRDLTAIFSDAEAAAKHGDQVVYTTYGCPGDAPGERLLYGTTVLEPGKVGDEYFMTRGHFHTKPERGELCFTISGRGILLLMDRDRNCRHEGMSPGSIHDIDGRLAHRVVNIGKEPLVFLVSWMSDCGHEYESIREKGFSIRVVEQGGKPEFVDVG